MTIIKLIAQGGFGTVFEGRFQNKNVDIKRMNVLPKEVIQNSYWDDPYDHVFLYYFFL